MQEEEAIFVLIRKISCEISSKMNRLYEPYGLTAVQFDVLVELSMQDGVTISQLAKRLPMSISNLSAVLQRLEKHAFVKRIRDDVDQRNVRIEMCPKTIEMMDDLKTCSNKKGALLKSLEGSDSKQLHLGLEKLYEIIKECDVE